MGFLRYSTPSNIPPVLTGFMGNPNVNITAISTTGGIVTSRDSDAFTAQAPYPIHCSASAITADGTSRPFEDLEFSWVVTGPEAGDTFTRPTDGATVNSFTDQVGPEAAFFLRTPGTYTITLNIRGRNGVLYTTASVSKSVTFAAFTAATTYYLDSTIATGGVGTTPATAFKTTAALNAVISTAGLSTFTNLAVQIKNGSNFTGQVGLRFNTNGTNKYTGVRVFTYSTGAKPIFDDPTGKALDLTASVSASADSPMYDIIFQGLSFKNTSNYSATIGIAATGSGTVDGLLRPIEHVYFDNCDVRADWDVGPGYIMVIQIEPGSLEQAPFKKWGFWKCSVTNPTTTSRIASGISGSANVWWFVYGTTFSGAGTGSYDHHIYPECRDHELYKWNIFGASGTPAKRGMCLNLNWQTSSIGPPGTNVIARWHLVSENSMSGTENAVDAGCRTNNGDASDSTTQFFGLVVERNSMFGFRYSTFMMQLPCAVELTVRDNRVWNFYAASFVSPPDGWQLSPYKVQETMKTNVYRNRIHIAAVEYPGTAILNFNATGWTQAQHWTDNIIADYRANANVIDMYFSQMIAAGIQIDRNQIYTKYSSTMAYDHGTPKNYAAYRTGTGFDPNGSNNNPGWAETVSVWADLN